MKFSIAAALLVTLMTVVSSETTVIRKKLKKGASDGDKCPPCHKPECVGVTTDTMVSVGEQYTSVFIAKDVVLQNEAYVNAQFLKIDSDGDGVIDGLEGFSTFMFFNEEQTNGQAVTVQSAYENREINVMVSGAYLRVNFFEDANPIFTLYNEKNIQGQILPLDVVTSLLYGTLNDSGLGGDVQYQLFKGVDFFVTYVFDYVIPDNESRRELQVLDPDHLEQDVRNLSLGRCFTAGAWPVLMFTFNIAKSCGVSIVKIGLCIPTVVGGPVAFGACLGLGVLPGAGKCGIAIAKGC